MLECYRYLAGRQCEACRAGACFQKRAAPRIVAERDPQHSKEFHQVIFRAFSKNSATSLATPSRGNAASVSVPGTRLQLYAVSLYSSVAILAPVVGLGNGTKTIPRCRSCTSVQTLAHSLHNQYRSTWRTLGRVVGEGATSPLLGWPHSPSPPGKVCLGAGEERAWSIVNSHSG